jgi:hypothetical protein
MSGKGELQIYGVCEGWMGLRENVQSDQFGIPRLTPLNLAEAASLRVGCLGKNRISLAGPRERNCSSDCFLRFQALGPSMEGSQRSARPIQSSELHSFAKEKGPILFARGCLLGLIAASLVLPYEVVQDHPGLGPESHAFPFDSIQSFRDRE